MWCRDINSRHEQFDGSLNRPTFQGIEKLLEARGIAPFLGGHDPYSYRDMSSRGCRECVDIQDIVTILEGSPW